MGEGVLLKYYRPNPTLRSYQTKTGLAGLRTDSTASVLLAVTHVPSPWKPTPTHQQTEGAREGSTAFTTRHGGVRALAVELSSLQLRTLNSRLRTGSRTDHSNDRNQAARSHSQPTQPGPASLPTALHCPPHRAQPTPTEGSFPGARWSGTTGLCSRGYQHFWGSDYYKPSNNFLNVFPV